MRKLHVYLLLAVLSLSLVSFWGCKAQRTTVTTATYSATGTQNGRSSVTITTKTVETYQGVKK